MHDTLAQLALEMVAKQLAVAVSGHSPAQHGVLYLKKRYRKIVFFLIV